MLARTVHFKPAPDFVAKLGGAISPGMTAKIEEARKLAASRAPRDTGALANSIEGRLIGNPPGTVSLEAKAPHAKYIIHGTDPHGITGNPTLRFMGSSGEPVFRNRVNHPGTKPNNFLAEAVCEVFR